MRTFNNTAKMLEDNEKRSFESETPLSDTQCSNGIYAAGYCIDLDETKTYIESLGSYTNIEEIINYFDREKYKEMARSLLSNRYESIKSLDARNRFASVAGSILRYIVDEPMNASEAMYSVGKRFNYNNGIGEDVSFIVWTMVHAFYIPDMFLPIYWKDVLPKTKRGLDSWNSWLDRINDVPNTVKNLFRINSDSMKAPIENYLDENMISREAKDFATNDHIRRLIGEPPVYHENSADETDYFDAEITSDCSCDHDQCNCSSDSTTSEMENVVKDLIIKTISGEISLEDIKNEAVKFVSRNKEQLTKISEEGVDQAVAGNILMGFLNTLSKGVTNTSESTESDHMSTAATMATEVVDSSGNVIVTESKSKEAATDSDRDEVKKNKKDKKQKSKDVSASNMAQSDESILINNKEWAKVYPSLSKVTEIFRECGYEVVYMQNELFESPNVFAAHVRKIGEDNEEKMFIVDNNIIHRDGQMRIGTTNSQTGNIFEEVWVPVIHVDTLKKLITSSLTNEDLVRLNNMYPMHTEFVCQNVDMSSLPDDMPFPRWKALIRNMATVVANVPRGVRMKLVNYKNSNEWALIHNNNESMKWITVNDPNKNSSAAQYVMSKGGLFVEYNARKFKNNHGYMMRYLGGAVLDFNPYAIVLEKQDPAAPSNADQKAS